MGTATFAQLGTAGQTAVDDYFGIRRVKFGKLTMSNSYATTGDSILISAFGMEFIDYIDFGLGQNSGGTHAILLSLGQTTLAPQDPATATIKIQAYWTAASNAAVFDEVTSTTDLSGYSAQIIVYGA